MGWRMGRGPQQGPRVEGSGQLAGARAALHCRQEGPGRTSFRGRVAMKRLQETQKFLETFW